MQSKPRTFLLVALLVVGIPSLVRADNGVRNFTGGSFTAGTVVGQTIALNGAGLSAGASTLTFSCPITAYGAGAYTVNWSCAGGNITITSADKSLSMTGRFNSGSMTYSGSGGGKGGHVVYTYAFSGQFNGIVTSGGVSELVLGGVSLSDLIPGGLSGNIGWNSSYSPLLAADPSRPGLLSADNITGQNLIAYGATGSGIGQFEAVSGLAQDAAKRLYISDSTLDRIARIDDLSGKNWAALGTSGAGIYQFHGPANVTVDKAGKIWVADAGNNRIVRFDDMTGKNWTAFGSLGAGTNQFDAPRSIAFDSLGRIYVADKGNNRLVRFDDLTGKNWAALSEIVISPYGYFLPSPVSVVIDPLGKVNIALATGYIVRMDDITGTNPTISNWGSAITAMSIDHSGSIYIGGTFSNGLAQAVNAAAAGYFSANLGGVVARPGAILALDTTSPPPAAPYLTGSVAQFGSANVGEPTPQRVLYLENIGAQPLPIQSITSGPDFPVEDNCPSVLPATANCRIYLDLDPTRTGSFNEVLSVVTSSVHPLRKTILLGTGTSPSVAIVPAALTFDPQKVTTASGPQTVTLNNTGTGPLTISSVKVSSNFAQTNNCPAILPAGNGCIVAITFTPSAGGVATGTLTFSDDSVPSGARQTVTLTGTGSAAAPAFTIMPESIQFPNQGVNTVSAAQSVLLTNTSGAAFTFGTPVLPASFTGSTTCGPTLANNASCSYAVQFTPSAAGPVSGTLTVPVAGRSALPIGLAGTGVAPGRISAIAASPSAIAFTGIVVGDNPAVTSTLTNNGGLPLGIRSVSFTGDPAYTIYSNNCPGILAGHATCAIAIQFSPLATTPYSTSGTLTIVDSTGAQIKIPITGLSVPSGN